jgi:hypothetical protein
MAVSFAAFLGGVAFATEQGAQAGNAGAPEAVRNCSGDRECDDANPRTNDFCERFLNAQQQEGTRCAHSTVRDECRANTDCNDQIDATRDTCLRGVGAHGEPEARCAHEASSNACRVNSDCDDSNPATRDYCQHIVAGEQSEARCLHDLAAGRCQSDQDCEDSDPCTRDRCVHGVSLNGDPQTSCAHFASEECSKRAMSGSATRVE